MPADTNLIVAALVRRDDTILLVEERQERDPETTWMLPGGKVESNESLLDALGRELFEETGLRLTASWRIAFGVEVVSTAGRYIAFTFDCSADGALAPNDPDGLVLRAEWVETDEALRRLDRVDWYDAKFLAEYVAGTAAPGAMHTVTRR